MIQGLWRANIMYDFVLRDLAGVGINDLDLEELAKLIVDLRTHT